MNIYFDNAATTPLYPEVNEYMYELSKKYFGNPSSIHSFGRESKVLLENSRKKIAELLQVYPRDIFFTSGGTEAINMGIYGIIKEKNIQHIVFSPLEHPAVTNTLLNVEKNSNIQISEVKIKDDGHIDLDDLDKILRIHVRSLVILMHANNEIGNMLPLNKICEICADYNALFLCDTIQTMGKHMLDFSKTDVGFAACSAHKFHGPKGVGFLYVNSENSIPPFHFGGGQERGMRSGTENVIAIAGMAKALEISRNELPKNQAYITDLKQHLIEQIKNNFPEVKFNGDTINGLYSILSISFPLNEKTEMLVQNLDINGIAVSGGSACHSGANQISYVIKEVNMNPNIVPIRFSFNHWNTKKEIDSCIQKIKEIIK